MKTVFEEGIAADTQLIEERSDVTMVSAFVECKVNQQLGVAVGHCLAVYLEMPHFLQFGITQPSKERVDLASGCGTRSIDRG